MKFYLNLLLIIVILIAAGVISRKMTGLSSPQDVSFEENSTGASLEQEQKELIELASQQPKIKPAYHGKPGKTREGILAGYKFVVYLPAGFNETKKEWPLLLFLHGAGMKGDDLKVLYSHTPIGYMLMKDDPNFITVAPLCPKDSGWASVPLSRFLKEIMNTYPVNKNRVYLTGISMGGHGAWALGCDFPHYFAAIAPLCGAGRPEKAARLKHLPVWAFHGQKDDVVPVEGSLRMIEAIEACGGSVQSTIYPDLGHNIGGIYLRAPLYIWFLSHQKGERNTPGEKPFQSADLNNNNLQASPDTILEGTITDDSILVKKK